MKDQYGTALLGVFVIVGLIGAIILAVAQAETIHEYCERVNPQYDPSWVGDGRFDSFVCKLGQNEDNPPPDPPPPAPEPTPEPPPMMCTGHCND